MTRHLPPEALDDWLAGIAELLGLDDVGTDETTVVLDVARDVAHGVARPAAPLTAYLLGLAVGKGVAGGADVGALTADLGRRVRDLATGRDDEGADEGDEGDA
ncbi:DUF6457 domain-containing protein [Cellulomonas sp. HZM]|uniref:DUF6457 domain-containing protein n=1 Tax=Cellulomonas sp. HZM TaxID=1454010 RepID=UPI00068A26BF|nr:DUF6457 domain-containing protein [Cellulomonas sp. HZM]